MGKRWTTEEKQELAELVQMLFDLSSFRSWAKFAEAAGVHPVSISKWQTGESPPEGYNVLRLLRASGALVRLQAAADRSAQSGTDRLEGHAVSAILSEVRAGFEKLQQQLEAQDAPRTRGAASTPRKAPRRGKNTG